jgi:hypothetical protein
MAENAADNRGMQVRFLTGAPNHADQRMTRDDKRGRGDPER